MKIMLTRYAILASLLASVAMPAACQISIDATGPVRDRKWPVESSSGGGTIAGAPLLVAVRAESALTDSKEKVAIMFILTNAGKTTITVPTSPNPADLEPADPSIDYIVETLAVCISIQMRPSAESVGTVLFGSAEMSGTTADLAPGETMEIRTRVSLPPTPSSQWGSELYRASALLGHETIKTVNGRRISESEVTGSAWSKPFTLKSLFGTQ